MGVPDSWARWQAHGGDPCTDPCVKLPSQVTQVALVTFSDQRQPCLTSAALGKGLKGGLPGGAKARIWPSCVALVAGLSLSEP